MSHNRSHYADLYDTKISKQGRITVGILFGIAFILFAFASVYAYNDDVMAQDEYCEMVDIGAWPDFKETFQRDCGGEAPKQVTKKLM